MSGNIKEYFQRSEEMPAPLGIRIQRRVSLDEVDVLGIVWYGRYARYFQEGYAALGRECGLSYPDFIAANLRAPIVRFHVDYRESLTLEEEFIISASLIWNEGARLNVEYTLIKQNGNVAATGYTVQVFLDGASGDICLASPIVLQKCRRRWKEGEFRCLQ